MKNEVEILLEEVSKDWFYRKDGSPLADLQYDMYLLTQCIEDAVKTNRCIKLQEKVEDFSICKNSYFETLEKILKDFSNVVVGAHKLDMKFTNSINRYTKSLVDTCIAEMDCLDEKEKKTVNDMLSAYYLILRLINTYIESSNSDVDFVNEPSGTTLSNTCKDFKIEDYLRFLKDFTVNQSFLKLGR